MASHTPGPWDLTEDHYMDVAYEVFRSQHATVESWRDVLNAKKNADAEIACNARLIAAAPELLAALDRLLETVEDEMVGLIDRKTIRARKVANITDARAAILKARGI